MPRKKPCIIGSIKCDRLPYPDCGEGRKPTPTGSTAMLLEFIRLEAIGGKKKNLEKLQKIDERDVFISLGTIAPLLLNVISLSEWKNKGIGDCWSRHLKTLGFPYPIKKKAQVEASSKNLVADIPKENLELQQQLKATYQLLHNFSYSLYEEKNDEYIQAWESCLENFVQVHRLICHLLAPCLLLPEQYFYKKIKNKEVIILSFRLHFRDPDYEAYAQNSHRWDEQQSRLNTWLSTIMKPEFERFKYDIHRGQPRKCPPLDNFPEYRFFERLINKLISIIFDAFSPYSEECISWGQLYTAICASCGAIIKRKRTDSQYCCDSCKKYFFGNHPQSSAI